MMPPRAPYSAADAPIPISLVAHQVFCPRRAWLEAAGFRSKFFSEKPLRYDALLALERAVLEQAENGDFLIINPVRKRDFRAHAADF